MARDVRRRDSQDVMASSSHRLANLGEGPQSGSKSGRSPALGDSGPQGGFFEVLSKSGEPPPSKKPMERAPRSALAPKAPWRKEEQASQGPLVKEADSKPRAPQTRNVKPSRHGPIDDHSMIKDPSQKAVAQEIITKGSALGEASSSGVPTIVDSEAKTSRHSERQVGETPVHGQGLSPGGSGIATPPLDPKAPWQSLDQEMAEAPTILFLTGHLEKIDPESIPALISESPFIQAALSSGPARDFMDQPMSLAQLVQSLGLPPAILNSIREAGVDPGQIVTPRALFSALGIDAQRVATELELLQNNLTLVGLSEYMDRAARLSQKISLGSGVIDPRHEQVITPVSSGADLSMEAGSSLQKTEVGLFGPRLTGKDLKIEESTRISQNHPSDPASKADPESMAFFAAQTLAVPASTPNVSWSTKPPSLSDPENLQRPVAPASLPMEWPRDAALEDALLLEAETSWPSVDSSQTPRPSMHQATFDPWAAMGRSLAGVDTIQVKVSEEVPEAELRSMGSWESSGPGGPTVSTQAPALDRAETLPPWWRLAQGTGRPSAVALDTFQSPLDGVLDRGGAWGSSGGPLGGFAANRSFQQPIQGSGLDGIVSSLSWGDRGVASRSEAIDPNRLVERLTEINPGGSLTTEGLQPSGRGDNRDEQTGAGQEGGQGTADRGSSDTLKGIPSGLGAAGPEGFGHQLSEPSATNPLERVGMSAVERQRLVQQVIDRATAFARTDGGLMRLDLASPEWGRLEVALEMNDDRLNLRLLTGSDGLRSALVSDLARLREALNAQNVQLGQVDLGLAGQPQPDLGREGRFDDRRSSNRDDLLDALAGSSRVRSSVTEAKAPLATPRVSPALPMGEPGRLVIRV